MSAVAGPSSQPYDAPLSPSTATSTEKAKRRRQKYVAKLRDDRNALLDEFIGPQPLPKLVLPSLESLHGPYASKLLVQEMMEESTRLRGRKVVVGEYASRSLPLPIDDGRRIPLDPFRDGRIAYEEEAVVHGVQITRPIVAQPGPSSAATPTKAQISPQPPLPAAGSNQPRVHLTKVPVVRRIGGDGPDAARPALPFFAGGFSVHSLGRVNRLLHALHPSFLLPIGYVATRSFLSGRDRTTQATLTLYVLDKLSRPFFRILISDQPEVVLEGDDIVEVLGRLYAQLRLPAPTLLNALEFFGFGVPTIRYLLQTSTPTLPPAYEAVRFVEVPGMEEERDYAAEQVQASMKRVPPAIPPRQPARSRSTSNASAYSAPGPVEAYYAPSPWSPALNGMPFSAPHLMNIPMGHSSHHSPVPFASSQLHRSPSAASSGSPLPPIDQRGLHGPTA